MKVNLKPKEVHDVYRLPARTGNKKTIITALTTVETKNQLITAVRDQRLSTHLPGLPTYHHSQPNNLPIYIAEQIPGSKRRLFQLAR